LITQQSIDHCGFSHATPAGNRDANRLIKPVQLIGQRGQHLRSITIDLASVHQ
jgi:hypothetical protein